MFTRFFYRSTSVANQSTGQFEEVGIDTNGDLQYQDAGTKRVAPKTVQISVPLLAASVDGLVFIADDAYQITGIRFAISTAGGAGANVQPRKCTGTTAPASGAVLTTAVADLNATTPNTATTMALTATAADLLLAAGDRIALDFSGTLTALVGVITIYMRRVSNS